MPIARRRAAQCCAHQWCPSCHGSKSLRHCSMRACRQCCGCCCGSHRCSCYCYGLCCRYSCYYYGCHRYNYCCYCYCGLQNCHRCSRRQCCDCCCSHCRRHGLRRHRCAVRQQALRTASSLKVPSEEESWFAWFILSFYGFVAICSNLCSFFDCKSTPSRPRKTLPKQIFFPNTHNHLTINHPRNHKNLPHPLRPPLIPPPNSVPVIPFSLF